MKEERNISMYIKKKTARIDSSLSEVFFSALQFKYLPNVYENIFTHKNINISSYYYYYLHFVFDTDFEKQKIETTNALVIIKMK